jgi:hypothetical protein
MPNLSQHQTKAKNNRAFLDSFEWDDRPDWAVVVAFYTAVHYVEQLRALDGQNSVNHQDRLSYVQANHRAIHPEYHQFLNLSKFARYDANAVFHAQVSNQEVKDVVVGQWLTAIGQYVEKYIAERAVPPKPKT